jgi:integration host factor subunit alpha
MLILCQTLMLILITGLSDVALTKSQIVEAVSVVSGFNRFKAAEPVETVIKLIKSALLAGDDALLIGFGEFCVEQKTERRGRNSATGRDAMFSARKVITFKCSGKLRDSINNP